MANSETQKEQTFLEYILELNEGRGIREALQLSMDDLNAIDVAQLKRIGLKTYAEGKWTIHTIFQHLIDWERIWCFRCILFARGEGSRPDAYDQEIMARNSNANNLTIEQLVNEIRIVRQSTIAMFESYDDKMLDINCEFYEYEMPLSALGHAITAHQIHHFNVIRERYLPLDK